MNASNAIQTPVEAPSIELGDPPVRIFATRDGDRVTGRVEFPYETAGRTGCPIDYHSHRPEHDPNRDHNQSRDRKGADLGARASNRLDLVEQWRTLCNEHPETPKLTLAQQVAATGNVGVRSLQTWSRKLDTEGVDGLRDHYVKPPGKVPTLDTEIATSAVQVCTWWAYRIGNIQTINTKVMATAVTLVAAEYPLADILATIDCYYAWPCNRTKMLFKTFARWAKHDFSRWHYRACDQADYQRGQAASRIAGWSTWSSNLPGHMCGSP
ncbi:MAG: hypothetical protein WBE26_04130 [Phycisphaerae bacterium]